MLPSPHIIFPGCYIIKNIVKYFFTYSLFRYIVMIDIEILIPPVFLVFDILFLSLRVQNIIFRSLRNGKRSFWSHRNEKYRFLIPQGR